MEVDADEQANIPEVPASGNRSLSSNYQYCSQSRKISIGVLVDSVTRAEAKYIKEAVIQSTENGYSSKGTCVKDGEQRTPDVRKQRITMQDTSPWVSTRTSNQKISHAAAVHDTEHTPSFTAASRPHPRSKLSEKASAAHFVKRFAAKTDLETDECREKNFDNVTYSTERGKVENVEHLDNPMRSSEPEVMLEKERVDNKTRRTETGGRESLRMKLWKVLENVSSPNSHRSSSQSMDLHPDKGDGKQSPIAKKKLDSDTIESDSEAHTLRRPMTRSLARKITSTGNQPHKVAAPKSTTHRKECPEKTISPSRGDCSGRLYGNFNDLSLPSMRNKNVGPIPGESDQVHKHDNVVAAPKSTTHRKECPEKTISPSRGDCSGRLYGNFNDLSLPSMRNKNVGPIPGESDQVHKHDNVKERQQSPYKRRSVPAIEKSVEHGNKGFNGNSSNDRRSDVFVEPKSGIKKKNSLESQLDALTEKHKKDKNEDKCHSLLQKKRNSVPKPSTPFFENNSHECLPEKKQEKPPSPAEKIFNTKGIRSFKSLLSSVPADCKPNVQVETPNGGCELNYSPLMKPSYIEDGEDRMSKSSTDATDSESSEDDSLMKGCRVPNQSSPEICTEDEDAVRHGSNKSVGHKKDVEMTGCSPEEESLKGIQDSSKLHMYRKQNHEDGLASVVALITVALGRVKAKVKSVSNKRSAEILRTASENIFGLMQDAESKIKTDVGKLNNLSQLKRKRLETKFQEQQEQLLGMYKKFKEDVDQHLQGYGGIIEDIEEDEAELKRYVERQRAAHKKSLSQVEQEIKSQLHAAESRIMDVQELAKEKMLQLKRVLAESVKQGMFG